MWFRSRALRACGQPLDQTLYRVAIQTDMSALGRFLITKKEADIAAFKTPDLRNVLVTGPYFHDGSQETLWDVIDHYNKGAGLHNPYLDQDVEPVALTSKISTISLPSSHRSRAPTIVTRGS